MVVAADAGCWAAVIAGRLQASAKVVAAADSFIGSNLLAGGRDFGARTFYRAPDISSAGVVRDRDLMMASVGRGESRIYGWWAVDVAHQADVLRNALLT
jgi:hypothetical protein